jgi:hypothetical protein
LEKFKCDENPTRITGILCAFLTIYPELSFECEIFRAEFGEKIKAHVSVQ